MTYSRPIVYALLTLSLLDPNARVSRQSCVSSGRHLMSVGGLTSQNTPNPGKYQCAPLLKVFDASSLTWLSGTIPADTSYEVPGVLTAVVGGGPKGGAKKLTPDEGWSTQQVEALFATGISTKTDLTTKSSTSGANGDKESSGSGTSSGGGRLSTGAIVGIGVGAAVVVFCAALIWFLVRRSKKKRTGVSYSGDDRQELNGHPGYWRPSSANATELGGEGWKGQPQMETDMMEKIAVGLGPVEARSERSLSSRGAAQPMELEGSVAELDAGTVKGRDSDRR